MEALNTFEAGWQQDADVSIQPKGSVRDALNGNLVNTGGNNYVYESVKGTKSSFNLPIHKTGGEQFVPIFWTPLGDRLFIVSGYDDGTTGSDGEIGIVSFDEEGVGTYTAVYYHADMLITLRKRADGYGIFENDAYQRAYWTDNHNQPRSINIAAPILNTTYATGSLVVGEQYMVLTDSSGSITHNTVTYGPRQAAGNVFTAVNANFTTSGSARVIKYMDVAVLDYTPEKMLSSIDFYSCQYGGNLKGGVKYYAYMLTTNDGYESDWGFMTNPVSIHHVNPASGSRAVEGSTTTLTNTGKYIELQISNIPSYFDKIKVMTVEVDQDYNVIRDMSVFYFQEITGDTMIIPHYGGEDLDDITIDDITITETVITKVKTMCMIKQRQILANLTEREELDWESTATITTEVYTMPDDETGFTSGSMLAPELNIQPSTGVTSGNIRAGGHYLVKGTAGVDYITYNGINYGPGQAAGDNFIGVTTVTTFTIPMGLSPTVMAVIRIQEYIDNSSNPVYKFIEIKNDYFNFKGSASTMYLRTFMRKETYRVGVLFHDNFGNPYFVRWIDDVVIPDHNTYALYEGAASPNGYFNLISLIINDLDITDIIDQISGVSIVIAKRDKTRLGQGLYSHIRQRLNGDSTVAANEYVPEVAVLPTDDFHGTRASYHGTVLGPDFDINTSIKTIQLQQGDQLEPVSELDARRDGGVGNYFARPYAGALDQEIIAKWFNHNDYTGNNGSITEIIDLSDNETETFGGGVYTIKNHDLATRAGHPILPGAAANSLDNKGAVGGRRVFFSMDVANFNNTASGNTSITTTHQRMLVNYYRPKGQLYGGTSEEAKANTIYYHTGAYLKLDAATKAAIYDAGTQTYVINGMQVFGGDTFVGNYTRVSAMFSLDYDDTGAPGPAGDYTEGGSFSFGVCFPVESEINIAMRYGRRWEADFFHNSPNGVFYKLSVSGTDTYQPESFGYNDAYSSNNWFVNYPALPVGFISNARYPYRARYSQVKTYGESIDNHRIFLVGNYKEADATYGEINNVRNGMDRLFYWQKYGIGYFPVNERETVSNALGAAIQLGLGGVMERSDIIDKYYGNQHQWSLFGTDNEWFWFDMNRKAMMRMSYNGQSVDVSMLKGLFTFFSEAFAVQEGSVAPLIFDNDMPLLNTGISGWFDSKHRIAFMNFKFYTVEAYNGPGGFKDDYYYPHDFTVAFSPKMGVFIGRFSFVPGIAIEHLGHSLMINVQTPRKITEYWTYNVGDIVSKNGINYVCYTSFTSSNPVAAGEEPDAGSSAYWKKANEQRNVHVAWRGNYCKFFGVVYPFYIEPVVNPKVDSEIGVDSFECYGNSTAFTDIYYSNSSQSSSDLNITAKKKDFKYIDNSWWFNTALQNNRTRLVDHYLKAKLVVKNYLTDPTVSLNIKKTIVYLKSFYRFKR